jgi:hypothetical protein
MSRDTWELPEGLPRAVKITLAAKMLGEKQRTVRSWVERGKLASLQVEKGMTRQIPLHELQRLEAKGYFVDWEAALE